jgi:hypothetical protein
MITIGYRYAQLNKTSTRWFVYFYAVNPSNGLLERQRIYINLIKSEDLKLRFANQLIKKINDKLDRLLNSFR